MYLVRTPRILQKICPGLTWRMPADTRTLYLTFDDGPIPEVTPWVLEQLRAYRAKATFFCVGENVERHPDILAQVLAEGHSIGNHTHKHLNGLKTGSHSYHQDVARCAQVLDTDLFRPPYGKLRPTQLKHLQQQYRIVMWDVLSGDFDSAITAERCYRNIVDHAREGSIVVLHDSLKAAPHLRVVLPRVLSFFAERGFAFEAIPYRTFDSLRTSVPALYAERA